MQATKLRSWHFSLHPLDWVFLKGLFRGVTLSGKERKERDMPELEKRGDKKFFFGRVFPEHSIVTVDLKINKSILFFIIFFLKKVLLEKFISFFDQIFFLIAYFFVEILGSNTGDGTFSGSFVYVVFFFLPMCIFYFFQRGGKDVEKLPPSKDTAFF